MDGAALSRNVLGVDRMPAMECRIFLYSYWFIKPSFAGLTQLVILMESLLGFLFTPITKQSCKNVIKFESFAENIKQN